MIVAAPVMASHFREARMELEELIAELGSAAGMGLTHAQAEELIDRRGQEVLRRLLQGWLDAQGPGDVGPVLVGRDGLEREEKRHRERKMESIFGEVEIKRLSYETPGAASLRPLDAELNLPAESYSHGVRLRVAKQAAKESFDEVVLGIEESTGAHVPKRQAEQLTQRAAQDFDAFYAEERTAEEPRSPGGSILVLSTDGKGVPMLKEDLRPETRKAAESREHKLTKRLSKGEKRSSKRMATVAAVYTVEEFVRSPEQIVSELRSVRDATEAKRPRPENKRVWASVRKAQKQIIKEMFEEALRRDPGRQKRWVAVVDGNKSQIRLIRKYARQHGVELVLVLDLIHVLEYLWKAAYVFHPEGSIEAERWVTDRLREVLDGKARQVIANMRRAATRAGLSAQQRKPVDTCARYLRGHLEMLRYDEYLAAGLPIASGVIEGACRYLVKDRMERTGARWGLEGAEAVLRLRAIYVSGDFEKYWQFHLRKEWERNHAHLYADTQQRAQVASPSTPAASRLRLVK
jgi:hypothetical protein